MQCFPSQEEKAIANTEGRHSKQKHVKEIQIYNIKQIHHVIGCTAKPCESSETNPLLKQDAWHLADTEQCLHR